MITRVAEKVVGTLVIEHKDAEGNVTRTIDLTGPWRRVKYKDLIREKGGADWFDVTPDERRKRALDLGAEIGPDYVDYEVTNGLFEKLIEPTLIQPTFVTHLPKELIPLAKLTPDDPTTIEVFECCINGQEIAPAYTEQNDPVAQREALQNQAGEEQQKLDEDFLVALEHGMPPAGGIGIGIDRLIMMLLGQESIRDVLLFPQLKPKTSRRRVGSKLAVQLGLGFGQLGVLAEQQQPVALEQRLLRAGVDDALSVALDAHDAHAGVRAQIQFTDPLIDHRAALGQGARCPGARPQANRPEGRRPRSPLGQARWPRMLP